MIMNGSEMSIWEDIVDSVSRYCTGIQLEKVRRTAKELSQGVG
jgi:hypothetical protein